MTNLRKVYLIFLALSLNVIINAMESRQVQIKPIGGGKVERISYNIGETIGQLKEEIEKKLKIPKSQQKLILHGQILTDNKVIDKDLSLKFSLDWIDLLKMAEKQIFDQNKIGTQASDEDLRKAYRSIDKNYLEGDPVVVLYKNKNIYGVVASQKDVEPDLKDFMIMVKIEPNLERSVFKTEIVGKI